MMQVMLFIPGSTSLKDRRRVVKAIKDKVKHGYNVSLLEADDMQKWQSAHLVFVMIAAKREFIDHAFRNIRDMIEKKGEVEISDYFYEDL